MRRLLLVAFALLAASATATAQEKWMEAPVTLSLTVSRSGAQQTKPAKNGISAHTASLERFRFGNADILAALVEADLIPDAKGWKLVVVWYAWADSHPVPGDAYSLYARRGSGRARQTVAIPTSLLAIEPISGAFGVRHLFTNDGETITGGSEKFEILSRLTIETPALTGNVSGLLIGTGTYVPVAGDQAARYRPATSRATLQGHSHTVADNQFGVIKGTLVFGAAKLVTSYDYVPPEDDDGVIIGVDTSIPVSVN